MSPTRFSGVHSALVTPFHENKEIDWQALEELVAFQKVEGINGIVIAGSTGESATLSIKEREQLVKKVKDHAGPMAVIAGAGANCTKTAIEMQKAMEDAGADATLQVVPYYNKPTQRGLYEHFSAIAKNARLPIIIYNAFGRTGIDMAPSTIETLAKEQSTIIGIKDANPHVERLHDVLRLTKEARPDFLVLTGEDSSFLSYLSAGGDGIISVISHIAAFEMLALYRSCKNGDLTYAQKIARKLNGLCKLIFSHSNPIPIKTILAAMGFLEKSFRLPLCPLSPDEEHELLKKCHEFSFVKSFKTRGFAQ